MKYLNFFTGIWVCFCAYHHGWLQIYVFLAFANILSYVWISYFGAVDHAREEWIVERCDCEHNPIKRKMLDEYFGV